MNNRGRRLPSGYSGNPVGRGRPHNARFSARSTRNRQRVVIASPLLDAHLSCVPVSGRRLREWAGQCEINIDVEQLCLERCSPSLQHRTFHNSRHDPS
ncbi:hypothetical protein X777_10650 [Ooceraea biroi]|uniref:Uncharacterized protein n=1 Tax=Ooceraea biroi TaxID=2015173 RepID=A0A026W306_OOCBI|nr:hypothetical protein X777_10650 [Ooceraea biroi]